MRNKLLLNLLSLVFALALFYNLSKLGLDIYLNTINNPVEKVRDLTQINWKYRLLNLATIYEEVGFDVPVDFQFYYIDTVVQAVGILKEGETSMRKRNDKYGTRHWFNTWQISLDKL
ncbi:MAG: hypothetical protein AAFO07_14125 [Bacteroidota bacterium]